jgi:hypothetical protein
MSDNPSAPLVEAADRDEAPHSATLRPVHSIRSSHSAQSRSSRGSAASDESTPLLARNDTGDHDHDEEEAAERSSLEEPSSKNSSRIRTPTAIALTFLTLLVITILGLGFAAPAVVEEYAKQAAVFEPCDYSIDSFTHRGVVARIRGDFMMDGSRVQKKSVRDLGRAGTWLARAVESEATEVQVYLPEYDNVVLGTAMVPPIVVNIRDGERTKLDLLVELIRGDSEGIRRIVNEWRDGRLGSLTVRGMASIPLKSGIFSLGSQTIIQTLQFKGKVRNYIRD